MAPELKNSAISELVAKILSEPFSVENKFNELNLEAAGEILQKTKDQFDESEFPTLEQISSMASFQRCKSLYCLLLMELELVSQETLPNCPMKELTTEQVSTIIEANAAPAEPQQNLEQAPKKVRALPPKLPPMPQPRQEVAAPETAPLDAEAVPVNQSDAAEQKKFGEENLRMASEKGRSYLSFSFRLIADLEAGTLQNFQTVAERSIAQALTWALECELSHRLQPGIASLWKVRAGRIPLYLDPTNSNALDPNLFTALGKLAERGYQWLPDGKFSIQNTVVSLRYILSSGNISKFTPALQDFAILLLLCGQDEIEGIEIENTMGIRGIGPAEITELAFRLLRIQKMKVRYSAPTTSWSSENLTQLLKDMEACLRLTTNLSTETLGELASGLAEKIGNVA